MVGSLYLCATPIGNLEDITLRVLRTLQEADLIAAEDTRHTRKLLHHYEITTPMTSYHEHNARHKGEEILQLLLTGKKVALVSDAGTPGISDPGSLLVNQALAAAVPVIPLPGATAAITALCVSGLPTERFAFEGFLPRGEGEKLRFLASLAEEARTMIFYEAPHRLLATLRALVQVFPRRQLVVARELTKQFEEFLRGFPEELLAHFEETRPRGEFTLILAGRGQGAAEDGPLSELNPVQLVQQLEADGMDWREAIKDAARQLGLPKREVYRLVKIKNEAGTDATPED